MKNKVTYYLIAFLAAAGIFFLGMSYGSRQEILSNLPTPRISVGAAREVSLLIDDGVTLTGYKDVPLPDPPTVLEVLKTVTSEKGIAFDYNPPEASPYGAFIKQIGEKKNGEQDRYWQYWVDGSQPQVAADRYELKGGETILWTFRGSVL
ncbi:MAG: DUF4430 domain-containing protein [Parcubacteria group bacterium]|nr:DUF4430 domain-containing protein [Parcubacteria group bacterium]